MLSSIPGAALKSVRIEGVLHEFSTIPGVIEDTTDILLNLKGVSFNIIPGGEERPADEPREVTLYRKGAGEVTAADIELPPDIEIANPGHHIATMASEDSILDVKLEVQLGTGFVAAEAQDRSRLPLGTIPIDSIYTPVRHVAYRVDPTRVGSATDLDRLTLEVRTNGTISPHEAVSDAAKILDRYLILFFDFGDQEEQSTTIQCRNGQQVKETDVNGQESEETQEIRHLLSGNQRIFRCVVRNTHHSDRPTDILC
jgi:DNA-directed RNA polymerase subunit alpha